MLIHKSDAQLLATVARISEDRAKYLIANAGGLSALIQKDQCNAGLVAALELTRRAMLQNLQKGNALNNPIATREYLQAELAHEKNEVFCALFLDCRHRVIAFEKLFFGTIDGASVHPRAVVQRALHHNAAALIVSHNHPSGIAEASVQDDRITKTLVQALQLVDVRLLDHVIVAGSETLSLAERGLL